ncbi:hypothetical protein [Terriglobus sp.]|uniref:hypothetical protein n=1 Tax=Terriglobus sp. TaxID=1889013 RepID=UPI003B0065F2
MDYHSEEYLNGLTDDDGEVRELTAEDFAQFRPIQEFPEMYAFFKSLKRPEKDDPEPVEIAPDVVRAFRSHGDRSVGEQVNSALRDWLREHAA